MTEDKKLGGAVRKPLYDARGKNTERIVAAMEDVDRLLFSGRWGDAAMGLRMVASMMQKYIEDYEELRKKLSELQREYDQFQNGFASEERVAAFKESLIKVYEDLHGKASHFLLPAGGDEDDGVLDFESFLEGS